MTTLAVWPIDDLWDFGVYVALGFLLGTLLGGHMWSWLKNKLGM